MKINDVIEGLTILQKYYMEDSWHIRAERDIIYLYKTDRPLTQEDSKKMLDAGWFQDCNGSLNDPRGEWYTHV